MRIAVGGISHETNTYAVASTGITGLDRFRVATGDDIAAVMTGTGTATGGFLAACVDRGHEIAPTLVAWAEPSGTIAAPAYTELKARLLAELERAQPFDAIVLDLHGAGIAEGVEDLEADLGFAIRAVVGADMPLAAVLDLHGNATPAMAEAYSLLLGCHLYPHTDLHERGVEAVGLVEQMVSGALRPVMHIEQLPMLLPTSTTDGDSPAARINQMCHGLEARAEVVDCTFMHGFPFTDIADVGSSIIVITNDDAEAATAVAQQAASFVWDHRDDFRPENDTPESASRKAAAAATFPVVINECSDNPGGGTPGDGTHLLRAMLEASLTEACFGFIADPDVVGAAVAAGVGATIDVNLGGKHDDLHGAPIHLAGARVRCLTDGRLVLRAMLAGIVIELGPTCRLTVDGIDIVVSSHPFQTIDPEIFLMHGIDVTRYRVVGLKSSNHFRAGFRDIAAEIITADSPGLTTNRVEVFEREHAVRPLWPKDRDATYG